MNFNPRTPYGVRPAKATDRQHTAQHFNPRTPYGVRPQGGAGERPAPHFNPRTPCGVRPWLRAPWGHGRRFQSTHPLRGATGRTGKHLIQTVISIHAPLAGCDTISSNEVRKLSISIHAPLAGCDGYYYVGRCTVDISIHAPLAGCDARASQRVDGLRKISIHAPLAGCDSCYFGRFRGCTYFNPRTPCGVRPSWITASQT